MGDKLKKVGAWAGWLLAAIMAALAYLTHNPPPGVGQ